MNAKTTLILLIFLVSISTVHANYCEKGKINPNECAWKWLSPGGGKGSIEIYVYDQYGNPLPNALVNITEVGGEYREYYTNYDGEVKLNLESDEPFYTSYPGCGYGDVDFVFNISHPYSNETKSFTISICATTDKYCGAYRKNITLNIVNYTRDENGTYTFPNTVQVLYPVSPWNENVTINSKSFVGTNTTLFNGIYRVIEQGQDACTHLASLNISRIFSFKVKALDDLNNFTLANIYIYFNQYNRTDSWVDYKKTDTNGIAEIKTPWYAKVSANTLTFANNLGYYDKTETIVYNWGNLEKTVEVKLIPVGQERVQIIFIVVDSVTGEYIQNATVSYYGGTRKTDSLGRVSFFEKPNDLIHFTFSAEGYETVEKDILFAQNDEITIKLTPIVKLVDISAWVKDNLLYIKVTPAVQINKVRIAKRMELLDTNLEQAGFAETITPSIQTSDYILYIKDISSYSLPLYVLVDYGEKKIKTVGNQIESSVLKEFRETFAQTFTPIQMLFIAIFTSIFITGALAIEYDIPKHALGILFTIVMSVFLVFGFIPPWLFALMVLFAVSLYMYSTRG